jgi:hypothetical protein
MSAEHSSTEVAARGQEIYERSVRPQVEREENVGKVVSINVETGEFEVGDDPLVTSRRLQAKDPNARIWTERIGYDAVYAVGGTLTRTGP